MLPFGIARLAPFLAALAFSQLLVLAPAHSAGCPEGTWSQITRAEGLGSDHVSGVDFDDAGRVWVATGDAHDTTKHGGGVSVRGEDGTWTVHRADAKGLRSDAVYSILATPDGVWAGTLGGTSVWRDGAWTRQPDRPTGERPLREVVSLAQTPDSRVWLAARVAVLAYDRGGWSRWAAGNLGALNGHSVTSFAIDPSGNLWSSSLGGGLAVFDPTADAWAKAPDEPWVRYAHDLAIDAQGRLWVGAGIGLVENAGGAWTRHTTRNSALPEDTVRAVELDHAGRVWIGTHGGLAVFEAEVIAACDVDTGPVVGLDVAPDGALWVSTWGRGLFVFRAAK